MRNIIITDMTLAHYASTLSFKAKVEIARHLDHLQVDVIDMPAIGDSSATALMIRTASAFIKHSAVSVCTGMSVAGVEAAAAAVANAKKARLKVELPVSPVQMEYSCHLKPQQLLALAGELFAAARAKCDSVEFCAADATRADRAFLAQMVNAAVEAGVDTVTLCDDEGAMLPDEFAAFIRSVCEDIPALSRVRIGILCRNTFGMAAASAVMAIRAGAGEVKCCVGSNDIPGLETLANVLNHCGDRCGIASAINYNELRRITRQIEWVSGTAANPQLSGGAAADDADTPLFDGDTPEAVAAAVRKLGYDLSAEDCSRVYDEFVRVSAKKKVGSRELEAIVASVALQVPPTYRLISYVINNGNIISSSAQIALERDGQQTAGVCIGDGPVDAAFLTLEQIIGRRFELDDFQIQAVTEGQEAVGSALVRLRSNGKLYSGNGISTDIIGASIRAYLNAVNKIVYEEAE